MRKIFSLSSFFYVLLSLVLAGPVLSAEGHISVSEDEAVILFLGGEVTVIKAGGEVAAGKGMKLTSGDGLRTGASSWAELALGEGGENILKVKENSSLELTQISPAEINLLKGELRALVEALNRDEPFEIKTPVSVCGVRGTGWDTAYDGTEVIVDVYEDEVFFSAISKDGSMEDPLIKEGKRGILEDPSRPIRITDIPPGKMREWKSWKEGFNERRGRGSGTGGGDALMDKAQKAGSKAKDMMKGKEGIFEKNDQDDMDERATEQQEDDNKVGYP